MATISPRLLTRAHEAELEFQSERAYSAVKKGKLAHPTRFERVTFAFGGQGLLEGRAPPQKLRRLVGALCWFRQSAFSYSKAAAESSIKASQL